MTKPSPRNTPSLPYDVERDTVNYIGGYTQHALGFTSLKPLPLLGEWAAYLAANVLLRA